MTRVEGEAALTERMFARVPDEAGYLHELVGGLLVREPRPGFRHGELALELGRILKDFAAGGGLGAVVIEAGFRLSEDPLTIRGPDVAFVRADRLPPEAVAGFFPGAPDLAVEIVSPANRAAAIRGKVREYLDAGARLVWVVYPETRTAAVHASPRAARFLEAPDVLTGGDVLPGLEIELARLFAERVTLR